MASVIFKIDDIINTVLFCILPTGLVVITGLGLSWNVYFIRRIRLFRKKYLKAIRESDDYGNYINRALTFKSEQVKYLLLLAMNSTEMFTGLCFTFSTLIAYYLWYTGKSVNNPDKFTNHNCTIELSKIPDVEFNLLTEIPIGRFIYTLGQIGQIWSLSCGINLIRYLYDREYKLKSNSSRNMYTITAVVTSVILITGSLLKLRILEILFEPLVQIIYCYIWIKHIQLFYGLLKSRVAKLKVGQASELIIIQAESSVNQFGIIMFLNFISYLCFLISELMTLMYFIVSVGILYGPCVISYVYGTVDYEPLLRTPEQFQALILADTVISIILKILVLLAFITISAHYSIASWIYFWMTLKGDLKTRFGCGVRTRYTPNPTNRLMFI